MTARAIEIAKIIDNEMPKGTDVQRFVLDRFSKDKISDLKRAVEILTELDAADLAMDDWEVTNNWYRK
jgi:hypothetical protein